MKKKCDEKYNNRKRFFSKMFKSLEKTVKNTLNIAGKLTVWPFIKGDLAKCKHGADVYYKAVESFGHNYYVKKAPEWCNKECARRAGDPKM